jgi:HEAT repeat protein
VGTGATDSRRLADDALAALSMLRSELARAGLIGVGNGHALGDVRSKAWFGLAMTGAPGAESPIAAALRKDPDAHVREEAVFALSRLPDDRGTRALIAAAEDRSLAREQRKRAVFWLSQSESSAAMAYLDKVLTAVAPAHK